MPHCTVEFTDNVVEDVTAEGLLPGLHTVLAGIPTIESDTLKSSIVRRGEFFVGNGPSTGAFVRATLEVLAGRPDDVVRLLGERTMAFLREYFKRSIAELGCRLTVHISEIQPDRHFRNSPLPPPSAPSNGEGSS